jgi:hypothetical protein
LKIIYHLSQEARNGMSEYNLPAVFERELFDFQANAVKLIARRLEKNGGAMIGDVVGLGKTITACASAPNSGSTRFLMAISGMSSIRCSPPTNSNAPWDDIYNLPMLENAKFILGQMMKRGRTVEEIIETVLDLRKTW